MSFHYYVERVVYRKTSQYIRRKKKNCLLLDDIEKAPKEMIYILILNGFCKNNNTMYILNQCWIKSLDALTRQSTQSCIMSRVKHYLF